MPANSKIVNLKKIFGMKRSKEVNNGKNLIHSTNTPLTEKELLDEIKKAEAGDFITVEEGMKDFEQWLQTREKK